MLENAEGEMEEFAHDDVSNSEVMEVYGLRAVAMQVLPEAGVKLDVDSSPCCQPPISYP